MSANEKLPDDLEFEDVPADLDDATPPVMAPLRTATPASDTPTYVMGQPEPTALERLGAFLRGGAQGATFRWGDELSSEIAGSGNGPDLFKSADEIEADAIPRRYAEGSPQAAMLASMRADNTAAQQRSPGFYAGGEAAGMGVATAPLMAANPMGSAARIATNAATGALIGGATESGGAVEGEKSAALRSGAKTGALLSGGLTALATAAPTVARPATAWLGDKADELRAAASGAYGQQMAALLEERGEEGVRNIGRRIEEAGLHKTGKWYQPFAGPKTYLRNATKLADESGEAIGASLDEATAAGVGRSLDDVAAEQMETVAGVKAYDTGGRSARSGAAREVDQFSREVGGVPRGAEGPAPLVTPRDLHGQKVGLEGQIYGPLKVKNETAKIAALRQLANRSRGQMYDVMDDQASPEIAQRFRDAMQNKQTAEIVKTLSGKRVGQEAGNQLVSLPGVNSGVAGAVMAGAPGAALAVGGFEAAKRYGKDALASAARGGSRVAGAVSEAGEPFAAVAASPAVQGQMVRSLATADDEDFNAFLDRNVTTQAEATQLGIDMQNDPEVRKLARQRADDEDNQETYDGY